jgi:hypothetical protein
MIRVLLLQEELLLLLLLLLPLLLLLLATEGGDISGGSSSSACGKVGVAGNGRHGDGGSSCSSSIIHAVSMLRTAPVCAYHPNCYY